jgi:hypothetical protein
VWLPEGGAPYDQANIGSRRVPERHRRAGLGFHDNLLGDDFRRGKKQVIPKFPTCPSPQKAPDPLLRGFISWNKPKNVYLKNIFNILFDWFSNGYLINVST